MKLSNRPSHLHSLLLACCLAAACPAVHAEKTGTTTSTTQTTGTSTTTIGTSATTEAKLTAEFADFLGGTEEAQTVVSGLRQGTAFDLVTETTTTDSSGNQTTTTTTTTIDPPTDTMGYGNVRITLRLAEAQLSQMGITEPTPEELSAVLLGGDLNGAQVDGILTLRADGTGWGQIARQYGMTVGQLMGKGAVKPIVTPLPANQAKATGKAGHVSSSTTQSGLPSATRSNGYIPSSKSSSASSARSNGYLPSGSGKASGALVTAAGGSVGGAANAGGKGQTNKITPSAHSAGTVSAGGHVSLSGAGNAGGGASALAPGQAKKN